MLTSTYLAYLGITVAMTLYVGHTLHRNGRAFLVKSFGGDETLADSINQLLVVGFYLVNLGFVSLSLKLEIAPQDMAETIEVLSKKVGIVLIVLGIMHFMNIAGFARFGKCFSHQEQKPWEVRG